MEIDVIFLTDLDVFNVLLNVVDPSEEVSFVTIFGVFDNTPCEIYAIDKIVLTAKGAELKGVDLLHDF